MIEHIQPEGLNDPRQIYTHVVTVSTPGTVVFVSGQYGAGEDGNLVSTEFEPQMRQALANLKLALAGAGAGPGNVTKVTHFIVDHDMSKLGPLRAEMDALFGDTKPASTLLGVARLALDGMQYEIEATAVLP
jgi:enamine deaminase RidA (YjgF/YER057c/UK114 family)